MHVGSYKIGKHGREGRYKIGNENKEQWGEL